MGKGDYVEPLSLVVSIVVLTLIGYFIGGAFGAIVGFALSMVFFGIPLAFWYAEKMRPPISFRITVDEEFPYFVYFIEVWTNRDSDYWSSNESVVIRQIRAEIADTPLDCDVRPRLPFIIKRDSPNIYFTVVCREIPTSITIETNENEYYEPLGCVNCALTE
jgi:hypothetical protein